MHTLTGLSHYNDTSNQVCETTGDAFNATSQSTPVLVAQTPGAIGFYCNGSVCQLVTQCNQSAFADGGTDVNLTCKHFL